MQIDFSGNGVISISDATRLMAQSPRVYSSFLLWLLSELFEQLPEIGGPEKPQLVFFFAEAHLLFDQAARASYRRRMGHRSTDRTGNNNRKTQGSQNRTNCG